ncbi:aldehyde dehydrogenase family protein [Streptomyces sp. RS10V-4]|uniref:aldehyde dehydrogenase family protein n=1 Tax=Streptomyces rhizoryzae TaxID=2932493 RepID=UPI002004487E|nr:aldehyde dehydrogenase family protein [Streptomyces rhizoryzae]MCK7622984.1 aldehyde dehydrogenase family protein [Streptomyces rhizoryzae]
MAAALPGSPGTAVAGPAPAAAPGPPRFLDALVPEGTYRTGRRETVRDVAGRPVAELTLAPALYVGRTLDRLRRRPAVAAGWPAAERADRLRAAATAFTGARLGGLDPEAHHRLVARTTGVPVAVVRAAAETVAAALAHAVAAVERARPRGALPADWRHADTGAGGAVVWRRRGHLLSVNASGNHPAVHSLWPEALALGYRVAVRPSRRDPFTAHRLVLALRSAGFADEDAVLLPCGHQAADELIRGGDLAMVFGGDEVVARYAGGRSGTPVLPQGPGRVKVLVTGAWEPYLDVIAESVGGLGGVSCLNATGVLVERDATGFAEALAERLGALRPLPPEHEDAGLPCLPAAEAHRVEDFLRQRAAGTRAVLGGGVHDLADGSAALRPAVHLLAGPGAEQLGVELPFPCAWVAPWSPADGTAPLRGSLVAGVATDDDALVDAVLAEPSVRNVYGLDRPTWWLPPGVPHDGFLAEFLMRATALARG